MADLRWNSRLRAEGMIWFLGVLAQGLYLAYFLLKTGSGVIPYPKWTTVDGRQYYQTETYQAGKLLLLAFLLTVLIETSIVVYGICQKTYLAAFAVSTGMLIYFGMMVQSFYNGGENLVSHLQQTMIGFALMWLYHLFTRVKLSDRQMKWLMNGLVFLIGFSIVMIAVKFILKQDTNGAYVFFHIGSVAFQPGEILKVGVILLTACVFRLRQDKKLTRIYFAINLGIMIVLVLGRDLGNMMVIFGIFFLSCFFLFEQWWWLAAAAGMLAGVLKIAYHTLGYVRSRFDACTHVLEIADGGQHYKSLMAILRNGILGGNFGPEAVTATSVTSSATDFVLNVMLAVFGAGIVIALLGFLLMLIYQMLVTPIVSPYHYLIGALSVACIFFQYVIHIGSNLNVIPMTGICLNFLSKGGTNLISSYMLLGGIMTCLTPKVQEQNRTSRVHHAASVLCQKASGVIQKMEGIYDE